MALEYTLNQEEIEPIITADAASVVRELVAHAIEGLDAVSLARGEARPSATESNAREQPEVEPQTTEGSTHDDTDHDEEEDDEPDTDEDEHDKDI